MFPLLQFHSLPVPCTPNSCPCMCALSYPLLMLLPTQVLFAFGALLHGSVYILMCTMSVVPAVIEAGAGIVLQGAWPGMQQAALLLLGLGTIVAQLLLWSQVGWLTVVMLLLWSAMRVAEVVWLFLRTKATAGQLPPDDTSARIKV